jgi:hypothetical protein
MAGKIWRRVAAFLMTRRLRRRRCPYCKQTMRAAWIRKMGSSLLCPDLHAGFLFKLDRAAGLFTYEQLDNGGDPMGIPWHWITWRSDAGSEK